MLLDPSLLTLLVPAFAVAGAALGARRACRPIPRTPVLAIGTVQSTTDPVTVEVESVSGQTFVGKLRAGDDHPVVSSLRPGVVLLVAFDPARREELSLPDDIVAVRSEFDQMLLRKGLVSSRQLDLIRTGVRAYAVVTALHATGVARENYREVRLDLLVSRPGGGQFAARETALVPLSALPDVAPGSIVDTYYRRGDESAVAVCVPPAT